MRLYHQDKKQLKRLFGHRVRFDLTERRLYSRDISNPPGPVKMMIKTLPDAVVVPEHEADLVDLLHYAHERRVPLVPRGGGTAGYGGAMPVKGGIVVDMTALDDEFSMSADGKRATLGAGMTFLDAEAKLKGKGKALRIMPTSAPAATLGGWLAQGGAGLGSLRYGWIHHVVDSARVVLPDGQLRTFSADELDVIADMEGTTGFITAVTLKVREDEPLVPFLATFPNVVSLQKGVDLLRQTGRPWTMLVHNPEFNELRNEVTGQKNIPKNQFSVVFAYEKSALPEAGTDAIKAAVESSDGKLLDDNKAAAEWDLRFGVFRAKRLGPSIVPGEAVVPTTRIGESLSRIRKAVKSPHWCMEGVVSGDDTIWFAYSLDDERRSQYPAAFGAAMAMLSAAKKVGGRSLGTGVYLSTEARHVFSDDRLERLGKFRRAVDRTGIMNPGKVTGAPIKFKPSWAPGPDVAMALKPGEPILKRMHGSSYVRYQRLAEARDPHRRGLSVALGAGGAGTLGSTWAWDVMVADADVNIRNASASARAFHTLSASPLGWVRWMREYITAGAPVTPHQFVMLHGEGYAAGAEMASEMALPYGRMLQDFKTHLVDQGFRPLPAQRRIAKDVATSHNQFGASHDERTAWADGLELGDKGDVLLFLDDTVSYKAPEAARNAEALLRGAGVRVAYLGGDEWCSGAVLLHAGQRAAALDTIKHNVEAITKAGVKQLVTPDAQAYQVLKNDYPMVAAELGLKWTVQVFHLTEYTAKLIDDGKIEEASAVEATVALHHPPILMVNGVSEETAKKVLAWTSGMQVVDLVHHGRWTIDVGAGGAVPDTFPEVADKAARLVVREAQAVGASVIVSSDPASEILIRQAGERIAAESGATGAVKVPDVGAPVPGSEHEAEAASGESGAEEATEEAPVA